MAHEVASSNPFLAGLWGTWGFHGPKKNPGLVPCPLSANSVPRGATKLGSQGCAVTHVLQSRLQCPCPSLVATLGEFASPWRCHQMVAPGWPHQDDRTGTGLAGMAAPAWHHQDGGTRTGLTGMALLRWWHWEQPCWDGTRMASPGSWHPDSLTGMVALGLAVPGWHWDGLTKMAPGLTSPGQH